MTLRLHSIGSFGKDSNYDSISFTRLQRLLLSQLNLIFKRNGRSYLFVYFFRDFSDNRITTIANGTFFNVNCNTGSCRPGYRWTIW